MTKRDETVDPRVESAIENALIRSFDVRPMRGGRITEAETKRRFAICEEIWRVLRLEQGRSVAYVCDKMFELLIEVIDTKTWEPSKRSSWITKLN